MFRIARPAGLRAASAQVRWALVAVTLAAGGSTARPQGRAGAPDRLLGPPRAAVRTLELQGEITAGWLAEKDTASAAKSAAQLMLLAEFAGLHEARGAWADACARLQASYARVRRLALAKDLAGARQALQTAEAELAELAKRTPNGDPAPLRRIGGRRAWMDILEGVYVDAKTSSSRETMELMAWMLADGAGQIALDQEDAAWRRQSAEVVAAACAAAVAAANGETDLKSVRESLKTVRAKCDVCHDASRR